MSYQPSFSIQSLLPGTHLSFSAVVLRKAYRGMPEYIKCFDKSYEYVSELAINAMVFLHFNYNSKIKYYSIFGFRCLGMLFCKLPLLVSFRIRCLLGSFHSYYFCYIILYAQKNIMPNILSW